MKSGDLGKPMQGHKMKHWTSRREKRRGKRDWAKRGRLVALTHKERVQVRRAGECIMDAWKRLVVPGPRYAAILPPGVERIRVGTFKVGPMAEPE